MSGFLKLTMCNESTSDITFPSLVAVDDIRAVLDMSGVDPDQMPKHAKTLIRFKSEEDTGRCFATESLREIEIQWARACG